jgi:hypothetical protein
MRKLIAVGAVAALLATLATLNWPATAQEFTHEVFVASDVDVDPDTNGVATIPVGTNDGILGADCQGNSPLGGTSQLPAQVLSELGAAAITLRIFNNLGAKVSGPVQVNCVVDVDTTTPVIVQRAKAAFK